MKEISLKIENETGLHARPASLLVQVASKFNGQIEICSGAKSCDGKSLIAIMAMSIRSGDEIVIKASGENEDLLLNEMENLIKSNFIQ